MTRVAKAVDRQILHAGDCYVTDRPITLSTLLGSCVAVCLYDPMRRVFGMNHFLLAARRNPPENQLLASDAGRYGMHAMELLINELLGLGAQRRNLKAKAFGGGNVLGRSCTSGDDFMCVGAMNVRFVREFLSKDRIPVVAADMGGNYGRQIHFTGSDYSVYVRRIESEQSRHLVEEERHYWRDSLDEHARDKAQIDYW